MTGRRFPRSPGTGDGTADLVLASCSDADRHRIANGAGLGDRADPVPARGRRGARRGRTGPHRHVRGSGRRRAGGDRAPTARSGARGRLPVLRPGQGRLRRQLRRRMSPGLRRSPALGEARLRTLAPGCRNGGLGHHPRVLRRRERLRRRRWRRALVADRPTRPGLGIPRQHRRQMVGIRPALPTRPGRGTGTDRAGGAGADRLGLLGDIRRIAFTDSRLADLRDGR